MGIIMVIIQNLGNSRTYSLGFVTTHVTSTTMVFMVKILFILFWTWVLNLICKDGHSGIAWLLVLFPFILLFVIMALVMISPMREGLPDYSIFISQKKYNAMTKNEQLEYLNNYNKFHGFEPVTML